MVVHRDTERRPPDRAAMEAISADDGLSGASLSSSRRWTPSAQATAPGRRNMAEAHQHATLDNGRRGAVGLTRL